MLDGITLNLAGIVWNNHLKTLLILQHFPDNF